MIVYLFCEDGFLVINKLRYDPGYQYQYQGRGHGKNTAAIFFSLISNLGRCIDFGADNYLKRGEVYDAAKALEIIDFIEKGREEIRDNFQLFGWNWDGAICDSNKGIVAAVKNLFVRRRKQNRKESF